MARARSRTSPKCRAWKARRSCSKTCSSSSRRVTSTARSRVACDPPESVRSSRRSSRPPASSCRRTPSATFPPTCGDPARVRLTGDRVPRHPPVLLGGLVDDGRRRPGDPRVAHGPIRGWAAGRPGKEADPEERTPRDRPVRDALERRRGQAIRFSGRIWVGRRIGGRLNAFNKQLPDTIVLLSNSLRAGSSFLQSVELVSRESPAPMGPEMGRVVREVNLGLGMEEALANMVRRIKSDDLDLMVTAIGVQQQVGGNLAEILDTIAFTIRERVRIKGEIRTLTAQGRYSGYLVAFLPVGIAVTLNFINPEFMQPLFTETLGRILLGTGLVMMFIGFTAIRRITDIKV
ncbi:MAG: hypothetical protein E6I28_11480 [Chloroflexi bacterium]|nr:MAG: hypothetical protein E6I28_11480 [Chloroflexota bacterium]